jgi:hypothetical protein
VRQLTLAALLFRSSDAYVYATVNKCTYCNHGLKHIKFITTDDYNPHPMYGGKVAIIDDGHIRHGRTISSATSTTIYENCIVVGDDMMDF